jgi:hypothetical protein
VRVDTEPVPPGDFIAAAVDLAVVSPAERHREIVARAADARVLAEPVEALRDCVEDAISGGDIAAFFDDIIPDAAESSVHACGARRCTTLPRGVMLGGKLRPAAPFYVLS